MNTHAARVGAAVLAAVATTLLRASHADAAAPAPPTRTDLLDKALAGPMAGVEDVVFAARPIGADPHWYASIGYFAEDVNRKAYCEGGRLLRLNLRTGQVTVLFEDPKGGVRDPCVHYDGRTILFSYRKGGTDPYNLYEIDADGRNLRQVTRGPFDDIEAAYLPDGDIVFVSTRCNRWVNCWLTQVAILYRCGPDGSNVRPLSSNNDHDNTPAVLPDGRILYTRWEYVDRSQVHFHHLWTANPDGTGQMAFFGNMYPDTVMIDARPIPGSRKIVAIFSPGHGRKEHMGPVTVVDPEAGPDRPPFARPVSRKGDCRDPYAFSEDCFLVAAKEGVLLMDGSGAVQVLARPTDSLEFHEPRPLVARPRERLLPPRVDPAQATGRLVLADVTFGRHMDGVRPGEVKKLLILETLPEPIHFSGGMEPITLGGSFMLERILGTVPVEADGSAYFEVPALRSVFFVAMDEHDNAIKRMQSFCTVMPGETTGCLGCHEERTHALAPDRAGHLQALRRPPSRILPVADVPDVFDFPRDIQPILDRHCLKCHDYDKREAGVILAGDRGPIYSHAYFTLITRGQVADGRNAFANRPPRSIGASASALTKKLDGSHHDVKPSPLEVKTVRYWIESGAPYPGTYAAVGSGMFGGYFENALRPVGDDWPSMQAAGQTVQRRCMGCHGRVGPLPLTPSRDGRLSRHIVYNLTRPEKSLMLLAPLAKSAGGYGICRAKTQAADPSKPAADVFADTADPDYARLLTAARDAKRWLDEHKRFDMPGFRPNEPYLREMRRYGILPAGLGPSDPVDPYATDRVYWQSFWYRPPAP